MSNQEIVCRALVETIRRRSGLLYSVASQPDTSNRTTKDIDYILEAKGQIPIAVEHSLTESFEFQTKHEQETLQVVDRISGRVQGHIPTDRYFKIVLPDDVISRLSRKERNVFVDEISNWVISTAPKLTCFDKHMSTARYIDNRILLECPWHHPKMNGKLLLSLWSPDKLEGLRLNRLRRLLTAKLPKLLKYRFKGFYTALAIEDNDISISSSKLVEDRMRRLVFPFLFIFPTMVFLFTTYDNRVVEAWILKEKGRLFGSIPDRGPFYDF